MRMNMGVGCLVVFAAVSCNDAAPPLTEAVLNAQALTGKAHVDNCQDHDDDKDTAEVRAQAKKTVSWRKGGDVPADRQVKVQILGFNDFHGQLSPKTVSGRPAGGAAVFASYLKAARATNEDNTFIVNAGDNVGASPPNSALLQDEPTISVLNTFADEQCDFKNLDKPKCNTVGTLGNHEFDEGKAELVRLLQGGNHPNGPFLEKKWKGARFPFVSANVVDESTGKPLFRRT